MSRPWLRWVAVGVFVLSYGLNYLDRQLLSAMQPTIMAEFNLNNKDYGFLNSAFSLVYMISAPLAGIWVDRTRLNIAASLAVSLWSVVGIVTGFVSSFRGLLACRAALGFAESPGIPCVGKANALYLQPRELSIGSAMNQGGISLGSVAAPLVVAWITPLYGWRAAFWFCGFVGLLWVPLWLFVARMAPPGGPPPAHAHIPPAPVAELLRDRRLWGLVITNILVMTLYSLWSTWTTGFFVTEFGMSQTEANRRFAWIPPLFAALGAFFGGWLAFKSIRGTSSIRTGRLRACWIGAIFALGTAAVPLMPTAGWAAVAASMSYFWCLVISTNVYVMPIDMFGSGRAAFGLAALTFAYGLMHTVISPLIGHMVDDFGFALVCVILAPLPLLGVAVLQWTSKPR